MLKWQKKKDDEDLGSVNVLKNHTADILVNAHSMAFGIFFVLEKLLSDYIEPYIPEGFWGAVMVMVGAVLSYGFVLKNVIKWKNRKIDEEERRYAIQGKWYHVHIPHSEGKIDYARSTLSCGETFIRRELKDFTFEASNKKYSIKNGVLSIKEDESVTMWHTVISEVSDSTECGYDILQIYNANTNEITDMRVTSCPCCNHVYDEPRIIQEAGKNRFGIHKINVDRTSMVSGRYTRLYAQYFDCWPSLKTGELLFYREKDERDARVLRYFTEKEKRGQQEK